MEYRKPEDKVGIDVWMRDWILNLHEISQQGSPKNDPIIYENPTNYKMIKKHFELLKETDTRQYKDEEPEG
jgi:hypothetical protein